MGSENDHDTWPVLLALMLMDGAGTGVAVGGTGVAVGGTGVAVGGTGVAVGSGTGVAVGCCAATGPAANKRLAITSMVLTRVRPAMVRDRKRPAARPTVGTQRRPAPGVVCRMSSSLPHHGGRCPCAMNLL